MQRLCRLHPGTCKLHADRFSDCMICMPWLLQVEEVKGIMAENIDRMLQRGEKLELLTDKTENLMNEVGKQGSGAAGKMWWGVGQG